MKKIIFLFPLLSFLTSYNSLAQCVAGASVNKADVVCNECVELTAYGNTGTSVFKEDFDTGNPTGWAFTQSADYTNPCSPAGVDGTPHMWMGNTSVNPRDMETIGFDLSLGGTICFDMLYSTQSDPSPCEGPDLPSEGVYLQYSVNGGATWVTIAYHDPLGGYDPTLTNWNNYCYPIPPGAMTTNTKIRWHQDAVSGADYDHWGIDNVEINLNDPLLNVTWLHDSYTYGAGNTGGIHPTLQCVNSDTSFIVMVTNGTVTCYDTVDVNVTIPTVRLDLSPTDTTICEGECFQINLDYDVLVDSAREKRYENVQPEYIDETGGGIGNIFSSTEVDLNVTGLNMSTIQGNSIKEVCITGLWAYRSTFLQTLDISDVLVELECPSGGVITLIPTGVTVSGGGPGYPNSYIDVCFQIGSPNISTGSVPYTGTWQPQDPFNNLVGCSANGIWKLRMSETRAFANLLGELEGFSITFMDDSVSYPGLASWNHTTWMTNPYTTPTVCALSDTTYIFTVSDSNNCVSLSDTVDVTIAPVPYAGRDSAYATCDVTPVDLFNYIGGGPAGGGIWLDPTNSIINMPISAGTDPTGDYKYIVTNIAGCFDTAIVNFSTGGVTQANLLGNDTSICSNDILTLSVNVPGSLYNWSTGATTSSININNSGTYWVNVTDPTFGCVITDTIVVTVVTAPFAGVDGILTICRPEQHDLFTRLQSNPAAGGTWYNNQWVQVNMPTVVSAGTYHYVVVNGICRDTSQVVVSQDGVTADFTYEPVEDIYYNETDVFFQETATNAQYFEWILDGTNQTFGPTWLTQFPGVGTYVVCLDAFNNNCHDTICKEVLVTERVGIFVPNAFTPDKDGKNDEFGPSIAGEILDYEFRVFDRWGQQVFYSTQIGEMWDGVFKGQNAKEDVYVWRLNYKTEDESGKQSMKGHVTLVR